jgi:hypothetical protein
VGIDALDLGAAVGRVGEQREDRLLDLLLHRCPALATADLAVSWSCRALSHVNVGTGEPFIVHWLTSSREHQEEPVMTQLPHVLKRIRLNLARSKEFPCSDKRGYEFVAPLGLDGRIDAELWRKHREHCGVRRFWDGEDDEIGRLVHKPGGAEHARWVSITTRPRRTTTRPAIASAITRFATASMSPSATRTARCTLPGGLRRIRDVSTARPRGWRGPDDVPVVGIRPADGSCSSSGSDDFVA